MRLLVHKGRHVVVATGLAEDTASLEGLETVQVSYVGLAPTVFGAKRRGRKPDYSKPVSVSELELMDHADATADLLRAAREASSETELEIAPAATEVVAD